MIELQVNSAQFLKSWHHCLDNENKYYWIIIDADAATYSWVIYERVIIIHERIHDKDHEMTDNYDCIIQ